MRLFAVYTPDFGRMLYTFLPQLVLLGAMAAAIISYARQYRDLEIAVIAVLLGGWILPFLALVFLAVNVGLESDSLPMFCELGGFAIFAGLGFVLGAVGLVFVPKDPR